MSDNSSNVSTVFPLRTDIRSPNFTPTAIPVEFVVVHYTACGLSRALELLTDPKREVSAHFVIDEAGTVYELVQALNGTAFKAWHSGKSSWCDSSGRNWEAFNTFSIGIEIVNENGNLFPYSERQYQSLISLLTHLKSLYPALASAERIIGHEQIAGFRGKSDPGILFDWPRIFSALYGSVEPPTRAARLPRGMAEALNALAKHAPVEAEARDIFFSLLSQTIESMKV